MTTKRLCKDCLHLSQSKYQPCKLGLPAVIEGKDVVRPNICKTKPHKNQKKIDYKKLFDATADMFQTYVRYRDKWTCVSCGKVIDPAISGARWEMQAGHYISRQITNLIFDEKNCHAQCQGCNSESRLLAMNLQMYSSKLVTLYGLEVFTYFDEQYRAPIHNYSEQELKEIYNLYRCKLASQFGISYGKDFDCIVGKTEQL